ncbi:MAG: aminoacyl-tRNA hydrolase [Candidatus Sericytochromatia bacterium]|nr:aminoacyl-tRNA hydrolase [Candidatus Sericytochromatia bacterium]
MLIVALGNPGRQYAETRHNAGWLLIDRLQERWPIRLNQRSAEAIWGTGQIDGHKVTIALPQTFMNLSGRSARILGKQQGIVPQAMLAVYDEVALPVGRLRMRRGGSAGGHNGVKSLIAELGTQEFLRLRIGVGPRPEHLDLVDFVLGRIPDVDARILQTVYDQGVETIETLVRQGADAAMQVANKNRVEAATES